MFTKQQYLNKSEKRKWFVGEVTIIKKDGRKYTVTTNPNKRTTIRSGSGYGSGGAPTVYSNSSGRRIDNRQGSGATVNEIPTENSTTIQTATISVPQAAIKPETTSSSTTTLQPETEQISRQETARRQTTFLDREFYTSEGQSQAFQRVKDMGILLGENTLKSLSFGLYKKKYDSKITVNPRFDDVVEQTTLVPSAVGIGLFESFTDPINKPSPIVNAVNIIRTPEGRNRATQSSKVVIEALAENPAETAAIGVGLNTAFLPKSFAQGLISNVVRARGIGELTRATTKGALSTPETINATSKLSGNERRIYGTALANQIGQQSQVEGFFTSINPLLSNPSSFRSSARTTLQDRGLSGDELNSGVKALEVERISSSLGEIGQFLSLEAGSETVGRYAGEKLLPKFAPYIAKGGRAGSLAGSTLSAAASWFPGMVEGTEVVSASNKFRGQQTTPSQLLKGAAFGGVISSTFSGASSLFPKQEKVFTKIDFPYEDLGDALSNRFAPSLANSQSKIITSSTSLNLGIFGLGNTGSNSASSGSTSTQSNVLNIPRGMPINPSNNLLPTLQPTSTLIENPSINPSFTETIIKTRSDTNTIIQNLVNTNTITNTITLTETLTNTMPISSTITPSGMGFPGMPYFSGGYSRSMGGSKAFKQLTIKTPSILGQMSGIGINLGSANTFSGLFPRTTAKPKKKKKKVVRRKKKK